MNNLLAQLKEYLEIFLIIITIVHNLLTLLRFTAVIG